MIKAYKESEAAWVENVPKIYDAATAARIEAPSAKTYDATTASWVERLVLDNYFTELAFNFSHGGRYSVSADKLTASFTFKSGTTGTDHASIKWEGKEKTGAVLAGSFETDDTDIDPDVYFYYQGEQVLSSKLRTQSGNLFAISSEGAVDEIVINIVPYRACTFSLTNLWFGQQLKFNF